jgi:hypothetical protein
LEMTIAVLLASAFVGVEGEALDGVAGHGDVGDAGDIFHEKPGGARFIHDSHVFSEHFHTLLYVRVSVAPAEILAWGAANEAIEAACRGVESPDILCPQDIRASHYAKSRALEAASEEVYSWENG